MALETILNAVDRVIFFKPESDHSTLLNIALQCLSIILRGKLSIFTMAKKSFHNLGPYYLSDIYYSSHLFIQLLSLWPHYFLNKPITAFPQDLRSCPCLCPVLLTDICTACSLTSSGLCSSFIFSVRFAVATLSNIALYSLKHPTPFPNLPCSKILITICYLFIHLLIDCLTSPTRMKASWGWAFSLI